MIPKILKKVTPELRLPLALAMLANEPSNLRVTKRVARLPKSSYEALKGEDRSARKKYVAIHPVTGKVTLLHWCQTASRDEDVREQLRIFVDQPRFEQVRIELGELFDKEQASKRRSVVGTIKPSSSLYEPPPTARRIGKRRR